MASNAVKKKTADTAIQGASAASKRKKKSKPEEGPEKTTGIPLEAVGKPERIPEPEEETKQPERPNPLIAREAVLWLVLAACIFLFISYFGIGGYLGTAACEISFGLFGIAAYAFPALLFLSVTFWISNRGNGMAGVKFGAAVALYLCICSSVSLLTGTFSEGYYDLERLYQIGAYGKKGGGVIGGTVCSVLCPALGHIGAGIALAVLLIVCLVLITQKSLMRGMKTQSSRMVQSAKESSRRRREMFREREDWFYPERNAKSGQDGRRIPEGEQALQEGGTFSGGPVRPEAEESQKDAANRASAQQTARRRELDVPVVFPVEPRKRRVKHPVGDIEEGTRITGDPRKIGTEVHELFPPASAPGCEPEISEEEPGSCFIDLEEAEDEAAQPARPSGKAAVSGKSTSPEESWESAGNPVLLHIEGLDPEETLPEEPQGDQRTGQWEQEQEARPSALRSASAEEEASALRQSSAQEEREKASALRRGDRRTEKGKKDLESWDTDEAEKTEWDEEESVTARGASGTVRTKNETPSGSRKRNARSTEAEIEEGIASVEAEMEQAAKTVQREYVFPPIDLLKKGEGKANRGQEQAIRQTAAKLQQTLDSFGVGVKVTNVSCGPSVTRYELLPEQGVKVSRIVSLADDIKLNLAAADIRIEAPIPGKSAVGIEVPNAENSTVALRDLIESDEFRNHKSKLAFATGKDIGGRVVVSDIAKMPHLLIAGATGSGKSVCINTLIMSIIYKAKPEEVKLIMIDPKVVELSVYNGIPHLFIPVVTDPKKAAGALNWAVAEMSDRYSKFSEFGVRDLKGYNQKIETALAGVEDENKPQKLPQIVIIVDELADLMMVAPGEVEESICRLAQLARAAGIHLIIATQRPSVNVITGLIKANMPSRIAFSVSSGVDSRTIIDMNGAEKLLGKGDMLFYPQGYQKPARVQGAFVSDEEVSDVVDFLKAQNTSGYDHAMQEQIAKVQQAAAATRGAEDTDELFADAGKFIIEKDKASIGMLQRVFKIGFNRAARIMDQLADAGVVGPEEGTKPRKILMSEEQFENYLEQN